jgi:TATA-box binding protein (TBP) (component of TFIID and TFIIIB)
MLGFYMLNHLKADLRGPAALRRASFMTGVKEVMDDPHRVVTWEDPMRTVLLIFVSGRIVLTGAKGRHPLRDAKATRRDP